MGGKYFGISALVLSILLGVFLSCSFADSRVKVDSTHLDTLRNHDIDTPEIVKDKPQDLAETIHIFVALCDNLNQGIVPVPAKIGNGQNPNSNLYWGCGYGIRSYFKKSQEWKLIRTIKSDSLVLERLVFKHKTKNVYLVADAYDGAHIRACTIDFLSSTHGMQKDTLHAEQKVLGIGGNSKTLAYIGHDGLMDFQLSQKFTNTDSIHRDVIILACYSKHYFSQHLDKKYVNPLVWTSGLMCPEAYTVHDALSVYLKTKDNEKVRTAAAMAYSKYQKCSLNAARRLMLSGY